MTDNSIILGLGASGYSAAKLLRNKGARVTVVDNASSPLVEARAGKLRSLGIKVATVCTDLPDGAFDCGVVSPGIRKDSDWIMDLESRGISVVSELELGGCYCQCPMLAVTGTNGKSSVAKLCFDALKEAGGRVGLGGNYGLPLSAIADQSRELDWVVVEVSSFQLEQVCAFHPQVAIVLNIQPDHLDRHGNMQTYYETKACLFKNLSDDDSGIVPDSLSNVLLAAIASMQATLRMNWITFGKTSSANYTYNNGNIRWMSSGIEGAMSLSDSYFSNDVLGLNAAAAVAALRECGCPVSAVQSAAQKFSPLPHRMEEIGSFNGIRFVNDSKATNMSALHAALEMCPPRGRLIAGGVLKETDFKEVEEMLAKHVSSVYLIGEASTMMKEAWSSVVRCETCVGLEDAVHGAWKDAEPGETILLSPGCASFDQYRNYQCRGQQFKKIVGTLIQKGS